MKVKCIKTTGHFIKDNYYDISFNYDYQGERLNIFCVINNDIWTFIKKSQFDEYFSDIDKIQTEITYEITYIQDGRKYITGINISDLDKARQFKYTYEELNNISDVKIIKITKTQEVAE